MFTRSSRHYRGIMTSFYSICIVLGTVCVNPLSAVPEFTVSGHVGSTAVLPCELQTEVTGTPHIKWSIESETVFERVSEETYQGKGYEGRVDVPEEELRKGNCSLVLRNLTPTDAAVYWSYKIVSHTKRSVETETVESRVYLSVEGKQKEERKAEKEVPRAGFWTGVGVGAAGTIAVIGVIGVIGAVVYWCIRRRNQNRRNPDPPQTYSLPNTQINPANTSQDVNPNDQGEHFMLNTSPDDHVILHSYIMTSNTNGLQSLQPTGNCYFLMRVREGKMLITLLGFGKNLHRGSVPILSFYC
ncbi:uncharacterized protein LOC128618009 isoform X2 [Ictalurus furcatus]|uniref:uncharacterized protein LOC128618009 isoform X2 n=1 Tax=Ictalurus furcatus TaxID=66913 RepID=UPI002350FD1A|nr:uncharacterized protein LOC128618009 isoform X2 [Ictalurus furcatus]XP_053497326.1 uncharacterized protein LOC128618009 isoform X2 [Ictalurus furcatus]